MIDYGGLCWILLGVLRLCVILVLNYLCIYIVFKLQELMKNKYYLKNPRAFAVRMRTAKAVLPAGLGVPGEFFAVRSAVGRTAKRRPLPCVRS